MKINAVSTLFYAKDRNFNGHPLRTENNTLRAFLPFFLFIIFFAMQSAAQTELAPWGNILGFAEQGQLMPFESSIRVINTDWSLLNTTGKEKQTPVYKRAGNRQTVFTQLDSIAVIEEVEDRGMDCHVRVELTALKKQIIKGVFFSIDLPETQYSGGSVRLLNGKLKNQASIDAHTDQGSVPVSSITLKFADPQRLLTLNFDEPTRIFLRKTSADSKSYRLFIPLILGNLNGQQKVSSKFTIHISGAIDRDRVNMQLQAVQGRPFMGFGGNFRLQNPKTDPQVIDYCLQNLRVARGRVEMPLEYWQPEKETDPLREAGSGRIDPRVRHAMEMAQHLAQMHIPVILSVWSAPAWAISGKAAPHLPGGIWGNALNTQHMTALYKSIADYIQYLHESYGTEVEFFSFNESDLGINIRQTGAEHNALIKGLGAYFISRGLKTKLLLGDNSDAYSIAFINEALNDPAARPFIGAVSFHSWRGWEQATLQKWADAAYRLGVPLIVAEGSIDAQAWGYPEIFKEQAYALQEISLYIRLLSVCQPESILQWQLTADYSPLSGAGIFGEDGPLLPTQRFWNMKQLASTPKNLFAMPLSSDQPSVTVAALGNTGTGIYTVHMVNNGAARPAVLAGIPLSVHSAKIFYTDRTHSLRQSNVQVENGKLSFELKARAYTTLLLN